MTVKLTGNFLATARCLIYLDGNAITWTFDPNTNELTATYTGAGSAGSHNPTATIGLTAVNGTAITWMTSDSAPALSQAIIPTWTGLHTFSAGITVSAGTTTINGHTLALSANASVGGTNTGDQAIPTGTNPSASIGLSAVNGAASTFMTSDSAPALSQAITPTWVGAHVFTPSGSVVGATFNAASGQYGAQITGNAASGNSFGLFINAGTTASDAAIRVLNRAATANYFEIFGDGHGFITPLTAGGVTWTVGGNFAFAAPSSGQAVAIASTGAGTAALAISASATTGAQTATFAASNKPGSGTTGPDKWLPIVLDGTTHYIPCFL